MTAGHDRRRATLTKIPPKCGTTRPGYIDYISYRGRKSILKRSVSLSDSLEAGQKTRALDPPDPPVCPTRVEGVRLGHDPHPLPFLSNSPTFAGRAERP